MFVCVSSQEFHDHETETIGSRASRLLSVLLSRGKQHHPPSRACDAGRLRRADSQLCATRNTQPKNITWGQISSLEAVYYFPEKERHAVSFELCPRSFNLDSWPPVPQRVTDPEKVPLKVTKVVSLA